MMPGTMHAFGPSGDHATARPHCDQLEGVSHRVRGWLIPRSSYSIESSLESIPTNVAHAVHGITRRAASR